MPIAALSLIFVASLAQPEPSAKPAPAETAESDALAGPAVKDAASRSLVERDFDGKLRRLEIPAEEAALGMLDLTESERAAADGVLADRAAALDKVIAGNLELLLRQKTAREAGNAEGMQASVRELLGKLGPLRAKGRLVDQLAAVLSAEHGAEMKRLTREYWGALIDAEVEKAGPGAERGKIGAKEMLVAVGLELKRAYEARISGQQQELDDLIAKLGLTDEREADVRRIALDFAQKSLGKPTAEQRRELFCELNKVLTAEQRVVLIREIYRVGPERTGAPSK